MNFSTKLTTLLNILLICAIATPVHAIGDGFWGLFSWEKKSAPASQVPAQSTPSVEVKKTAEQISNNVKPLESLDPKKQGKIKALYGNVKQFCKDKKGQFFAFVEKNKDKALDKSGKALGIVVTYVGITYIVYRTANAGLQYIPMTQETKEKYSNKIKGGMVVVGLSASAALHYYGYTFNYLVEKNSTLAYSGLAIAVAAILVGESSFIRNFLFALPSTVENTVKTYPKTSAAAAMGLGAGLYAGISNSRLGSVISGAAKTVAGKATAYTGVAVETAKNHPRITAALALAGVTAGLYGAYKYGFKVNRIKRQLNKIKQQADANNLAPEVKVALKNELTTISTDLTAKIKSANDEMEKLIAVNKQEKASQIADTVILPCNTFLTEITAILQKLN